jgi:glycosyltransferase involved in cell wall biosynthesis
MKLGIVIPTYQKPNGQTPTLLTRALNSIKSQTHQDYKVFLIGDKYDDEDAFIKLSTSIIDSNKIFYQNLPNALEREKYPLGSQQLWCSGGVNARNYGIEIAMSEGLAYICPLDHDDYWHPNHLSHIANVINQDTNTAFVYTCSTYIDRYIPAVPLDSTIIPMLPVPCNLVHSSVCINHSMIPLQYRDVYAQEGRIYPSDADLWARIALYINEHKLSSYLIKEITCYHPTENQ